MTIMSTISIVEGMNERKCKRGVGEDASLTKEGIGTERTRLRHIHMTYIVEYYYVCYL